MPSYKTAAIILSRTNYGEADRIYHFLTPHKGKVSAIAKGVRRSGSKLGPHLEPFNRIDLMLATGRNLDIVTSARSLESYAAILSDLERLKRGFLFSEMINKLTGHQTGKPVFDLLKEGLAALDNGLEPKLVELGFKLKLLDVLGHRPDLMHSVKTHTKISPTQPYGLSYEGGGLVEKTLAPAGTPILSTDTIKLWRLLLSHPIASVAKVKNVAPAATQSLPMINDFYTYQFDKRFRSQEI